MSAPGRADATVNSCRGESSNGQGVDLAPEPVRDVDVAHVLANEECDKEAAHAEMDFDNVRNVEADDNDHVDDESEHPVPPPCFFSLF